MSGGTGRGWSIAAAAGAVVLVLTLGTVGWLMVRPSSAERATWAEPPGTTSTRPTTTSASPTPAPTTAKPTPTKTTTKPKPRPTPTRKPPPAQLPPAPKPKPDNPSCETHLPGTDASKAQVKAALTTAAGRRYWDGVRPPAEATDGLPPITVPVALMKAEAWTESTWRSTIIACDGGIGLMQVMPATADFVNQRFGLDYDVKTLDGNAALGAAYLEWLTVYFGLYYFGGYDLDATADIGPDGASMMLRDAVIAAYNVGPLAVENDNGTPSDYSDDYLSIPNQWYVDRVVANLASSCPCQQ